MGILEQKVLLCKDRTIQYTVIAPQGNGLIIVRLDSYNEPQDEGEGHADLGHIAWHEIKAYKTNPTLNTGNPLEWPIDHMLEHRYSPIKDDPAIISIYVYWVEKYSKQSSQGTHHE
jgi:hypothetical protein